MGQTESELLYEVKLNTLKSTPGLSPAPPLHPSFNSSKAQTKKTGEEADMQEPNW